MPTEDMWASFFNVEQILSDFEINSDTLDLVEVGCGYGTFTIPVAKKIKGKLYAFDIEKVMLDVVHQKILASNLHKVILELRDVLTQTTGLPDNSIDYVMLFNILHHESPDDFFTEAIRVLKPSGKVGILHWRSDIETPRGPHLSIRPKPEQILHRGKKHKLMVHKMPFIVEPFHYGLVFSK